MELNVNRIISKVSNTYHFFVTNLAKNSNTKIKLLTHTNTERWSDTESEKTVLLGCILTLLVEQI